MKDKELNARQLRWMKDLMEYDFSIQHIKGDENQRADALSRRPDYGKQKPVEKALLKQEGKELRLAAVTDNQTDVIRDNHDSRTSGHQGVKKTLMRVKEKMSWKGMKKDVEGYVAKCFIC